MTQLHHFFSYLIALLAITNPLGNLAIFISLTSERSKQDRQKTAIHTAIAIAVILIISTWIADYILNIFGISVGAFKVAGGIVISMIALSMLHTQSSAMHHSDTEHQHAKSKENIAVVPLALPIVAGPGAITTAIVYVHEYHRIIGKLTLSLGDITIAAIIGVLFWLATPISRLLGTSGLRIATRVMGLILLAIAIGLTASGLLQLLPGLK